MLSRNKLTGVLAAAAAMALAGTLVTSAQAAAPASVTASAGTTVTVPALPSRTKATHDAFDAHQAVAVDRRYFYAIGNRSITKHDKRSGEPLLQFAGRTDGPIDHLDSGVVVNGKLYAAHSNYPQWPMESSIEVFDTRTMNHVDTHSFGIHRGSLTWLDRHDGAWWAAFANYDREHEGAGGQIRPYGYTYNTQVVEMDDAFQVVESWTIPKEILDRFELMSNSGGSWGPDDRLYLTGHDLPEAYVLTLPDAGSELEWVATVSLPGIEGQGIAWEDAGDRSDLWAISRQNSQVVSFSVPAEDIPARERSYWDVLGPGEFQR
jgi:hypothetical protein